MATQITMARPKQNPNQAAIVAQRSKLLSDRRLVAAVTFINSAQAKFRPSLVMVGEAFDKIHRIAGGHWTWWLANHCEDQTGVSAASAREYERMFQLTRLQTVGNPVAEAILQQADTTKPRNIDSLNKTLASKAVRSQIASAGRDPAKVKKIVSNVIALAKAKPVSIARTEAQRFDLIFERLKKMFAEIALSEDPTKSQVARSRRLASILAKRIEGLARTLQLDAAGYHLSIRFAKT